MQIAEMARGKQAAFEVTLLVDAPGILAAKGFTCDTPLFRIARRFLSRGEGYNLNELFLKINIFFHCSRGALVRGSALSRVDRRLDA